MRILLFKLLNKMSVLVFPDKTRAKFIVDYGSQQVILHKKELEMNACIRPRTYPRVKGGICKHTDYFESGENWGSAKNKYK